MTERIEGEHVLAAWQRFTSDSAIPGALQSIRPVTVQAWDRCRQLGIDPHQLEYRFLSDQELNARRTANRHLLDAARPYMEYLSNALRDRPHVVALSDHEGWIIEIFGEPESFGGRSTGIWQGASWAESAIGNNGIGTALAVNEPVLVFGVEHYATPFHPASCLGIPIHHEGRTVGALDVSVLNQDADPERLTLVQACVRSIESHMSSQREAPPGSDPEAVRTQLDSIVHDVKQPLTAIRATAELGLRNVDDEMAKRYFEMLITQVDRVTETLDGAGLEPDDEPFTVESVGEILRGVSDDALSSCRLAGIDLRLTVQSECRVRVQRGLLSRALRNLATNAIQAMPDGGVLHIELARVDGTVRIILSDTGSGIPDLVQDRVFEPFFSGRDGGSGLGLYMVRHAIVDQFGGKVWFETVRGAGTTFFVELPCIDAGTNA